MVESIYNFKRISPDLATGGQPDENELHELSKAGFEVVINLGLADAEYSIPDEKEILEHHGIEYFHLPVTFDAPEMDKFFEFSKLLKSLPNKKLFIHCAANMRVSVFVALFNMVENGVPQKKAMEAVQSIWDPNEVWRAYMNKVLELSGKNRLGSP